MDTTESGKIYAAINKLELRIAKLEETRPFLVEMIEKNTASNEKLIETLSQIEITLEKFDNRIGVVENAIKQTDDKVSKISKEVEVIEEKGKFDIWAYTKTNLPWIILIVGLGASYLSKFVKF